MNPAFALHLHSNRRGHKPVVRAYPNKRASWSYGNACLLVDSVDELEASRFVTAQEMVTLFNSLVPERERVTRFANRRHAAEELFRVMSKLEPVPAFGRSAEPVAFDSAKVRSPVKPAKGRAKEQTQKPVGNLRYWPAEAWKAPKRGRPPVGYDAIKILQAYPGITRDEFKAKGGDVDMLEIGLDAGRIVARPDN